MATASTESSSLSSFSKAWQFLAHSQLWFLALLALGTASNAVYIHAPLDALAVVAGLTLTRRRATVVALLLWLVNQAIGFGLRGYPLTVTALTWGVLMGLGSLVVVVVASVRPRFCQTSGMGYGLWAALSMLGGFVIYQGLILLVYPLLADGHFMDWQIVLRLFERHLQWAGAIALGHGGLLWRQMVRLPPPPA